MLKIVDVDVISDHALALTFSDGYQGHADLAAYFSKPPFSEIKDFKRFSLTPEGSLNWSGNELSAATLRTITKGEQKPADVFFNVQEMEAVIKQASWESMKEGRPDILQAAIRSYVEQFGQNYEIFSTNILVLNVRMRG